MQARDPQTSPARGARRRAGIYGFALLSREARGEDAPEPEWLPGHGDVETSTVEPDTPAGGDEAIEW